MKKRIFALLLCLVCALSLGGCQPEQIDYDTSPLSFETVFDDTPGNPDKPDQPEDFAFHVSHHPPAYRVHTYDFEEDTICKGAFYILSPEDSYEIEELPPEKGIIKGVFTSPSPMRRRTASLCATHKFTARACSLSPSRAASLRPICGSPFLSPPSTASSGFRATSIITERNILLTSTFKPAQKRRNAIAFRRFPFPQREV